MPKIKVKLNICGTDYIISSDEEESRVRSIGEKVAGDIEYIVKNNSKLSITQASVLTSLDYCDECNKAIATADNLRTQLKDYLSDNNRLRAENDDYKKELDIVKKENQSIRLKMAELENYVQQKKNSEQKALAKKFEEKSIKQVDNGCSSFNPPLANNIKPQEISANDFMTIFNELSKADDETQKKD